MSIDNFFDTLAPYAPGFILIGGFLYLLAHAQASVEDDRK